MELLPKYGLMFFLLLVAGCNRQTDISVTIKNVGRARLDSVVLFVTGNSHFIGTIEPGTSKATKVYPSSESHLEIAFRGKRMVVGGYFEPGYSGTLSVSVDQDSVASITDSIRLSNY